MENSRITWVETVFDWCVLLLIDWANFLNISYEEINIWIFVIIGPSALVISILLNLILILRLHQRSRMNAPQGFRIKS